MALPMAELNVLKEAIEALEPADQLSIASELVRAGKHELGMVIAENVVADYKLTALRGNKLPGRPS